ncbi:MAG: hypothetical protein KC425_12085 [Anaerolineales bacterium]|nr:hypothetical protein [Anaerolineales bacterium]
MFLLVAMLLAGCAAGGEADLDTRVRTAVAAHGVTPLDFGPAQDPARVALGQALFFDKLLSGNRDVSCATCHHPTLASGDALPVSIGTGGRGLGPDRVLGHQRGFIPRNATELFNRGAPAWRSMFWDSRVVQNADGSFTTPADELLPPGLENVLAAQAMFPVTSAAEMRGASGDWDVNRQVNELALSTEEDFDLIWRGLMARLLAEPGYVALFAAAYPGVPPAELSFVHAANALAAFEIDAFTLPDSPWDRYLRGDAAALSDAARRGALLFYGDAGCAQCHSGSLFTDQAHHNIGVPQVGPGKGAEAPLDLGRGRETGGQIGRFAFRTPPLRNVAATAPYMHNGAFADLETAVRHHFDPVGSCRAYDETAQLPAALWGTLQDDDVVMLDMLGSVSPLVRPARALSDAEVVDLLAFLEALTDPAVYALDGVVPTAVPSGLPVSDG